MLLVAVTLLLISAPAASAQPGRQNTPPVKHSGETTKTQNPRERTLTNAEQQDRVRLPDEDLSMQRELAAATRALAKDTQRLADYTLALVGVGALVGLFQLIILVRQNLYTGKAAAAAEENARAALSSVRPYISITEVRQFRDFASGAKPQVLVTVQNSGQTPGHIIEAGFASIPVRNVQEHLPRPMPDPGMRPQNLTIAAGQRLDWGNQLGPVATEDFELVAKHHFKLVLFGRITYRDMFGGTHHSDFSFVYNPQQWVDKELGFVIDPNGYSDAT